MKWLIPCAVVSCCALQSPASETIAYWPFGESGLQDASGNGHALSGGAAITDCATFGGSADAVLQTVSSLDLSGKTAVTIEFFAKVKDSKAQVNLLEHGSSYDAQLGCFQIDLNERNVGEHRVAALWYGKNSEDWFQTIGCIDSDINLLQDGRWHHVAVVLKTDSESPYSEDSLADWCLSLYIDGVIMKNYQRTSLTAMTGPGLALADTKLFLGSRNNEGLFLDGQLDDIRITDGVLMPTEFLQKRSGAADARVLAYWPFGSRSFADASGSGRHLHASPGVSLADDGAAAMDGDETFFQTICPFDLRAQENGLTVECYFKTESSGNVQPLFTHIASFNGQPKARLLGYLLADGRVLTSVITSTGDENADVSTEAYNDGNWHHVAWVLDPESSSDTARLYVDGVCVPVSSVGPDYNAPVVHLETGFLALGCGPAETTTSRFDGEIDDVRVTGGALEPEDFLATRTTEAGSAEPIPEQEPFTLAYWKFDSRNGLKDETGLYPLTMPFGGTVRFEGGAAVFTGIGGLATTACPDLLPYKKLTLEFFLRYPQKNVGDTAFDMNFVELSSNFDNVPGAFRLSSDIGYGDYPARAGALFRTGGGDVPYSGDLYGQPTYGDGEWHHWTYRIDNSGESLVTELYVDGVKVPHDSGAFTSTVPTDFPLSHKMFLGIRSDSAAGVAGDWKSQKALYGEMDDVRLTAGWLKPEDWIAERSAEDPVVGRPIARWTFDGENPLEDVTGNGCNLSADGVVEFHDGVAELGNGILYLDSGAVQFDAYRALTIEMVYRSENPFDRKSMLFELGDDYTDYGSSQFYCLMTAEGEIHSGFNGNDRIMGGRPVNDGEWTHVALSVDLDCVSPSDQVKFFVNGERAETGAMSVVLSGLRNEPLRIGARRGGEGFIFPFDGEIADVALTEGALGSSDFVLSRPSPVNPQSTALVYWPFKNGKPLADLSGNGFTLETNGGVTFQDGCAVFAAGGLIQSASYLPYAQCAEGLTVECWVKCNSTVEISRLFQTAVTAPLAADQVPGVMGVDTYADSSMPFALYSRWNMGYVMNREDYPLRNSATAAEPSVQFRDGSWHHVAMVVDPKQSGADRARLYVDFQRMPTFADRACDRDQPFVNGRLQLGGDGFVGMIDDLRVTAEALSPDRFLHERSTMPGMMLIVR